MKLSIGSCAASCLFIAECGWTPSGPDPLEPVDIDWPALEQLAITIFDVSCHDNTSEFLQELYQIPGRDALVRPLPHHQRYLFLVHLESGRQSVFFAGANIKYPQELLASAVAPRAFDSELGASLGVLLTDSMNAAVDDLEPMLDVNADVSVVGYSSGGALAAVVGAKLLVRGYHVATLVTFGQPPVTDAYGARSLSDLPLLRVVAGRDLMTMCYRNYHRHFGAELVLFQGLEYAYLEMGDVLYSFASNPDVGRVDFFAHTNYLPRVSEKLHDARRVPYHLTALPFKVHGVFPCDFSEANE